MSLQKLLGVLGAAFTGEIVTLNGADVTTSDSGSIAHAGIDYRVNGTEFSCTGAGVYDVSRGSWLEQGSSSNVWFQRTINTGSLDIDPGAGRLPMTSARLIEVQDSTIPGGPVTCNVTITMWDAATSGNKLDEKTFTLSAERIV